MAIVAGDIVQMYSVTSGSAGASTAGTGPGSLGKYVSTTAAATSGTLPDFSGPENSSSAVKYRCIFVQNNHATLTAQNAVVYISAETPSGTATALAVDNVAVSNKTSSSAQADQIANETTAPTAVGSWSSPTTSGTGLALGNIGPDQVKAFWVRETAANTGPVSDGATISIGFDTAP